MNMRKQSAKKEQRRFARLIAQGDVEYNLTNKKEKLSHATSKNISGGGICITSPEIIAKNETLSFTVRLPQSKNPIRARGKVVWTSAFIPSESSSPTYDIGIEFTHIDSKDHTALTAYLCDNLDSDS